MWRRRERRVVEPFQRATHFADAVKFSPWQENEPSTTSKYNLAPDRMHEVAPHFILRDRQVRTMQPPRL